MTLQPSSILKSPQENCWRRWTTSSISSHPSFIGGVCGSDQAEDWQGTFFWDNELANLCPNETHPSLLGSAWPPDPSECDDQKQREEQTGGKWHDVYTSHRAFERATTTLDNNARLVYSFGDATLHDSQVSDWAMPSFPISDYLHSSIQRSIPNLGSLPSPLPALTDSSLETPVTTLVDTPCSSTINLGMQVDLLSHKISSDESDNNLLTASR